MCIEVDEMSGNDERKCEHSWVLYTYLSADGYGGYMCKMCEKCDEKGGVVKQCALCNDYIMEQI